ncbi:MAG: hypothetical protein NVSMB2_09030 [Chloroflexota bacterium]
MISSRSMVLWVVLGIVLMALVLAVVFWIGVALAVLGITMWLNLVGFGLVSSRLHAPMRAVAIALLPLAAGLGFALGQTGGLAIGAGLWALGVAVPQILLWRLRGRLATTLRARGNASRLPVIEARYRPLDDP